MGKYLQQMTLFQHCGCYSKELMCKLMLPEAGFTSDVKGLKIANGLASMKASLPGKVTYCTCFSYLACCLACFTEHLALNFHCLPNSRGGTRAVAKSKARQSHW